MFDSGTVRRPMRSSIVLFLLLLLLACVVAEETLVEENERLVKLIRRVADGDIPASKVQVPVKNSKGEVLSVGDPKYKSFMAIADLQQLYMKPLLERGNVSKDELQGQMITFASTRAWPRIRKLKDHEKRRILVTGGAGFVGSHLVDRLMIMGHYVICLDNFFTGNRRNVEHWIGHPNFELVRHDIVESYLVEVDEIYHLACPASPPHYQYNPIKTLKTNFMGTLNMLGLAQRVKARFLLTSTSEVYGNPKVHPQVETYWGNVNPVGPRACYDEGKRAAETLTISYRGESNMTTRIARIFNTFGPRMNEKDGRVVSNFIVQAIQGKQLTVYGGGEQTRSFQYVHDLVDGLIALMNGDYPHPVNIGNPEEFTIKQFAEMIRDIINPKSYIANLDATTDDPEKRKPDISRAKKELGWEPRFSVKQGLQETIAFFRMTVPNL